MTLILVEGESDRVVLETLAARMGRTIQVIAMGGATSVRHYARPGAIGLCDVGEERFFARVLDTWFVCDPDLEGELIRALGIEGVEAVLESQGELGSFQRLQGQPFQRDRTPEQQLARFFGGRSGNKARYGRLMAEAVRLDRIPAPLLGVLDAAR